MKTKHQNNTKSHTTLLLFISHDQLVCYESSCGHKVEEVTPKQTGYEHVRRKQYKTKQAGTKADKRMMRTRESSLQSTSSPGRDSGGKTKRQKVNKGEINKGQPHIIRVGQEKKILLGRLRKKGKVTI